MIIVLCKWATITDHIMWISECGKAVASAKMHLLLDRVKVTPLVWRPEREDYSESAQRELF